MVIFNSFLLNYQRVPQNDNSEYRYKDDDEPVDLRDVPIDFLSKPNDLNGGIARIDRQKTDKNGILRWIIFFSNPKVDGNVVHLQIMEEPLSKTSWKLFGIFLGTATIQPTMAPNPPASSYMFDDTSIPL